jgi:hypothetical protein
VATTQRATRIEKEERITALLLDMISDIEVLALLLDDDDKLGRDRLLVILGQILQLRRRAIQRRNKKPGA